MSRANEPMIDLYIQETNQLLDRLEQIVIECEKNHNLKEHINEIFRIMHTIKGNSMMMMYDGIAELAHCAEDIFDYYRQHVDIEIEMTVLTDIMLEILDFDKAQISLIEAGEDSEAAPEALVESLKEMLEGIKFMNPQTSGEAKGQGSENESQGTGAESQGTGPERETKPEQPKYFIPPVSEAPGEEPAEPLQAYKMKIVFQDGCEMENIRAFTIQHQFKNFCEGIYTYPVNVVDDDRATDLIRKNGFHMVFMTSRLEADIEKEAQSSAFVSEYDIKAIEEQTYINYQAEFRGDKRREERPAEIQPASEAEADVDAAAERSKTPTGSGTGIGAGSGNGANSGIGASVSQNQTHINVDVSKIDLLMDLIGELVVSEAMVTRNPDLSGIVSESFEKATRQHRMIINELQDLVMSVRMVPLSLTFQKMNRIVRDMSKKINKKVDLTILGEDTEVDKNIIEHIGDPLMHIIRNSVDHGIEDMEARRMAGKSETGKVVLEAKHTGGEVWIVIEDDGKGLDRNKILQKAEEKGMVTKNPADLSDGEVFHFIFAPGFSTKDAITEFSGRGVGLDVVSKNITELGGTIQIESTLGKGTVFKIKIPLTLAIMEGMMMRVGSSFLAVPIINVQESFSVKTEEVIMDPNGNEFLMLRGKCYPILRLHKRFGIQPKTLDIQSGILIMIEYAGKSVLLFADEIIGEQQLVVKSLSKFMRKVRGISGCALLGDGKISLILDPSGLVEDER